MRPWIFVTLATITSASSLIISGTFLDGITGWCLGVFTSVGILAGAMKVK